MTQEAAIKLFESKKVRSVWDREKEKWYFSIVDVVEILTDSPNPRDYWYRIKQREKISGIELSTICRQFKLAAQDGKLGAYKYLSKSGPNGWPFCLSATSS